MKGKGLFITLVLGLTLTAALLWVLGSESPPAAAAPSAPDAGADWDGLYVSHSTVISDAGTYRMWYQGRGFTFYGWGIAQGYAESPNGMTWEKYAGNPVLEPGESGEWDSAYRGQTALIKDDATYKMWYSGGGFSGACPREIGYATSSDGLEWDIYAGNPVLEVGAPGSWDELLTIRPTVIKDGGTYKMWYMGCREGYVSAGIGYATSPDGIAWTKYAGNPVLEGTPGAWDESGIGSPRVINNVATYEMWYQSDGKIGRATSPDGVNWTKDAGNPVLSEGWDGAGVGLPTVLLDGDTYKMWAASGAGATAGIGYFESADGIVWTQPVSNPILVKGEAGVIIDVRYDGNQVRALTLANTPVTITVSDSGGVKATISGVTGSGGWYYSWEHYEDWSPAEPDILPGDTVSATTPSYSTIIETVGEVEAQAHNDTDLVEGTIHAPWFAPGSLSVICRNWGGQDQYALDRDVPADGGSFECDFSGRLDIVGGTSGQAGYLEPDGDMVSVGWKGPYMEVYYGTLSGAGGLYAPGHTIWITVTNSAGDIKATVTVTSTANGAGGWWGGDGFCPTWVDWQENGDWGEWSPAEPDIQAGDWVFFQSDDGYENQVRAGAIYGTVDLAADSVTGPIYATWLSETLEVWCYPEGFDGPPLWRGSSAEPDGSVPYFCEWHDPTGGQEGWDIQPDDEVVVSYLEPDGDIVYRTMLASEGAPLPRIYLPLVLKNYSP